MYYSSTKQRSSCKNFTCLGVKEPFHYLRVSRETKSDYFTWSLCISEVNGQSMSLNDRLLSSEMLSL